MLRLLVSFLHGLGIGIANVIPGVSGGTMALIFGIYEAVLDAVNGLIRSGLSLVRGDFAAFRAGLAGQPWAMLVPLGVGVVAAPLVGAGLIEGLLQDHPQAMRGLFFGLIAGSVLIPWLRTRHPGPREYGLAVLAAVVTFYLVGLPPREATDPVAWQIVAAAAVAISAMVLPGISGAFLLLVLGMYAPTLRALDTLDLGFLSLFVVGAGLGLAAFAVFLGWLLKRHHDPTMAVLVGLMAGSLRALWPWQSATGMPGLPGPGDAVGVPLWLLAAGLAVAGSLTWWEWRRGLSGRA